MTEGSKVSIALRLGWPVRREYRTLALGQAINTLGDGLSTAILPLYFLAITSTAYHLTVVLVAVAICGAMGGSIGGVLADRYGHRQIAVASFVASGTATGVMVLQSNVVAVTACAAIAAGFLRSGKVSRNAYIGIQGGAERVQLRAYLRSVLNVSYSLGAALALVVVLAAENGIATRLLPEHTNADLFPYLVGLTFDAATSIAAGCVYLKLQCQNQLHHTNDESPSKRQPTTAHVHGTVPLVKDRRTIAAWKDIRFLQMSSVLALLVSFYELCSVLIVVYIVDAHGGPKWLVPVNVALFVLLSLALQMKVAQRVVDLHTAAQSARCGGLIASSGLLTLAAAPMLPHGGMIAAVFVATVIIVLGDVMASAGRWELEMGLARNEYMGQYQGVSDLCNTATASTLPVVALAVTVSGMAGWSLLIGATSLAALRLPHLTQKVAEYRQSHRSTQPVSR